MERSAPRQQSVRSIFMKREELKARGFADEDVDFVLNAWHNGQKDLLNQVQALTKERDKAMAETKK